VDAAERGAELGVQAPQRGVGASGLAEQQAPSRLVDRGPLEGVDLVDDQHVAAPQDELLDGDPVGDAVAVVHGTCRRPASRLACGVTMMPAAHAARARLNLPHDVRQGQATAGARLRRTASDGRRVAQDSWPGCQASTCPSVVTAAVSVQP
jgi:hypothetical protein